jgi:hypothetical protein
MPDEAILREKARAVIQSGKLPSRRPDHTRGGPGVGASCTVCDLPVKRDELEFEIQFEHDGDNPGLAKFHVHIRCFAVWELERNKSWPIMAAHSVREISIPISSEDMSRLCPHDSGLPDRVRTALKDRKRTTEATNGFESTLREDEGRSFLSYAARQGFTQVALELRKELKKSATRAVTRSKARRGSLSRAPLRGG